MSYVQNKLKIKPTLATDGYKCKKLEALLEEGLFVSPKLDGYRCLAEIKDGKCILWSRNGKEFKNFPQLNKHLEEELGHLDILLDGEVMSDDFSAIQQSAFAIKRGTVVGDIKYHIFDIPSIKDTAGARFNYLESIHETDMISPVYHKYIYDMYELNIKLQEALDSGYEGIMAQPDKEYIEGRKANNLLKFKPQLEMDCIIKGFVEGTGKYKGTLGALEVLQPNGKICGIGTGFTDFLRDKLWCSQDIYKGKMIEAHYQELTDDGIMRFPVFNRFREDKE